MGTFAYRCGMETRQPPLIAFDLDGTIAHTEALSYADVVDMLQTHFNIPLTLETWYQRYHGMAGPALINQLNADFATDLTWEVYLAARNERIPAMFAKGVNPAPGVLQVLRQLESHGYRCCLVSNSQPQRVELTLKNLTGQHSAGLNLIQFFANRTFNAINAQGQGRAKPAPDAYLAAAAHYNLQNPATALAIEDSPTGVQAAVAAGFTCWGYTGLSLHPEEDKPRLKAAGAQKVFTHWDDFLKLLHTFKPKPKK